MCVGIQRGSPKKVARNEKQADATLASSRLRPLPHSQRWMGVGQSRKNREMTRTTLCGSVGEVRGYRSEQPTTGEINPAMAIALCSSFPSTPPLSISLSSLGTNLSDSTSFPLSSVLSLLLSFHHLLSLFWTLGLICLSLCKNTTE